MKNFATFLPLTTRSFQAQGRDGRSEAQIIELIAQTLDIEPPTNIHAAGEWLKDGQLLLRQVELQSERKSTFFFWRLVCRLLNKLAPEKSPIETERNFGRISSAENLHRFLARCRSLGFCESQLFEVSE